MPPCDGAAQEPPVLSVHGAPGLTMPASPTVSVHEESDPASWALTGG